MVFGDNLTHPSYTCKVRQFLCNSFSLNFIKENLLKVIFCKDCLPIFKKKNYSDFCLHILDYKYTSFQLTLNVFNCLPLGGSLLCTFRSENQKKINIFSMNITDAWLSFYKIKTRNLDYVI